MTFINIVFILNLSTEGLRGLAKQVNEENAQLRSCKELVAESYKYFESLSDIATEISLATALVNVCQSLMKHSETYMQQHKDKHGKCINVLLNVLLSIYMNLLFYFS